MGCWCERPGLVCAAVHRPWAHSDALPLGGVIVTPWDTELPSWTGHRVGQGRSTVVSAPNGVYSCIILINYHIISHTNTRKPTSAPPRTSRGWKSKENCNDQNSGLLWVTKVEFTKLYQLTITLPFYSSSVLSRAGDIMVPSTFEATHSVVVSQTPVQGDAEIQMAPRPSAFRTTRVSRCVTLQGLLRFD